MLPAGLSTVSDPLPLLSHHRLWRDTPLSAAFINEQPDPLREPQH